MKITIGLLLSLIWMIVSFMTLKWRLNRMFAREENRSRSPFKEKLLRSPGESLRLRIDVIQSDLLECGMMLAVVIAVTGALLISFRTESVTANCWIWSGFVLSASAVCCWHWRKFRKLREELRNYRLGFDGERYVAEKLSDLIPQGYRVFHDFVFDMKPGGDASNFNIDHIVIGSAGVFAVETKTFRQPNAELAGGDKSHEITVNNGWMILPGGYKTRKPVEQARRNAEDLSKWLSGSVPGAVRVIPIVAMPGWFVKEEPAGDVRVVSGRALPKLLPWTGIAGSLTDQEILRIADRVEAHCRNVEGA